MVMTIPESHFKNRGSSFMREDDRWHVNDPIWHTRSLCVQLALSIASEA